jgi:hypothetical protein
MSGQRRLRGPGRLPLGRRRFLHLSAATLGAAALVRAPGCGLWGALIVSAGNGQIA